MDAVETARAVRVRVLLAESSGVLLLAFLLAMVLTGGDATKIGMLAAMLVPTAVLQALLALQFSRASRIVTALYLAGASFLATDVVLRTLETTLRGDYPSGLMLRDFLPLYALMLGLFVAGLLVYQMHMLWLAKVAPVVECSYTRVTDQRPD